MIALESLLADLQQNLNTRLATLVEGTPLEGQGEYSFKLIPDGGEYETFYRKDGSNKLYYNILGVGEVVESAITPVGALQVQTQTVNVTVVLRLEQDKGVEDKSLFMPVRQAIADYASTVHTMTANDGSKIFNVGYSLTQPLVGEIAIRPDIGRSITYNFSVYYSFVQNGVNSTDIKLYIEDEQIYTEDLTIVRMPVQDAGAFNGTNGTAKNITTQTALEISFTTPVVSNSTFSKTLYDFLTEGDNPLLTVKLSNSSYNTSRTYTMTFGQCNISTKGIENAGYSVALVEALDI